MKKFNAKITYTMDKKHPDIKYIKDWNKDMIYEFKDTYTFLENYTYQDIKHYISNDLKLVAGGGYDYKHIHHVKIEIKQIRQ